LKVTESPALAFIRGVRTRKLPRRIYTSFVLRERLENNAANEGKIKWWSSQWTQTTL